MISTRCMTSDDIPLGMRLVEQAGWNQLEADWRRFLALKPQGCFVGQWQGTPVGTVTTCLFGRVGWIGMLLVDRQHRGRGVGSALLAQATGWLQGRGAVAVRLDATLEGRRLYETRGFQSQLELARYVGISTMEAAASPRIRPLDDDLKEAVFALDCQIVGAERRELLDRLFAEQPGEARIALAADDAARDQGARRVAGYVALRMGRLATHIGPCLAIDRQAGEALLGDALGRHRGQRVLVDVALDNRPAVELVEAAGLAPHRPFTRMTRMLGPGDAPLERVEALWASSGPEKG